MKQIYSLFIFLLAIGSSHFSISQSILVGKVSGNGEALPGASVLLDKGAKTTVTRKDGTYKMLVGSGTHTLTVSFAGYSSHEQIIQIRESDTLELNIDLQLKSENLSEAVIVGSRSLPRSNILSPLPIDVLSAANLSSTGQISIDKQMQYRVPSFNSINVPVRDATTFFDPYELRNLGPSRTLVLINGKRKNATSLLYVQFAPGRGETGVDLATIPVDAVKRIEILRDGASSQYGSDAIAGVINIILKDKVEYNTLSINSGVTSKGDGLNYGLSFNGGSSFKNKSFVNYTIDISQQDNAIRSGVINRTVEKLFFGGNPEKDRLIDAFLDLYPTGRNTNGTGDNSTAKFNINFGVTISDGMTIYGNAGVVARKSKSNANYRTPYWRLDYGLLHTQIPGAPNYTGINDPIYEGYLGYAPSFEGDLLDHQFTLGIKTERNKWIHDISFTTGGNSQRYTVENTVNKSLGTSSPTFFKPGGYSFSHLVGNYDVSKNINSTTSVAFGAEVRSETYQVMAGDTASYSGEGANSFPGMRAENASTNGRFNMGIYGDITHKIGSSLLLNSSARGEMYSDFGHAFVWKISGRQNIINDRLIFRTSLSTGFRAPTLHQIYTQSTVLSYVSNNIEQTGLFSNRSKQAFLLGVPRLKAEKSLNFTTGLGLRMWNTLDITIDYYSIRIRDRIFYSAGISAQSPNTPLGQVLKNAGVVQAQFFLNGLETQTSGIDLVLNQKIHSSPKHSFSVNLAGNFQTSNKIVGQPKDPELIKSEGGTTLSQAIRLLLTDSRPKYKTVAGLDYRHNKLGLTMNNTLFGSTRFQDIDGGGPEMNNIQQVFSPSVVTDFNIRYNINNQINFSLSINNIFNVLPKWDLIPINSTGEQYLKTKENEELLRGLVSFGGRYSILGASGSQFSQLGTIFQSTVTIKF